MANVFKKYNSILEFYNDIKDKETRNGFEEKSKLVSSSKGTKSWDEACNYLLNGDLDKLELINKYIKSVKKVKGTGESIKPKRVQDVAGFQPCVPAAILGLPRNMYRNQQTRVQNTKVVNFLIASVYSVKVDSNDVVKKAAEYLSEIYQYEKRGYRVNLYIAIGAEKYGQEIGCLIKVKDSNQYMNLSKLVYPLVNPSLLRRHFLRWEEVTEGVSAEKFASTYGRPVTCQSFYEKNFNVKIDKFYNYQCLM
jgi:hypothetical protein